MHAHNKEASTLACPPADVCNTDLCEDCQIMLLLQVVFADRDGTSAQTALHHPPYQGQQTEGTTGQALHTHQSQQQQLQQQQLMLQPQQWSVVYCKWQPHCSGRLTAQAVIAHTGDTSAIVWDLDTGMGGVSSCLDAMYI